MPELHVQTLFRAGEHGYHTFRIPSLVPTPQGTLLALCEGRRDGRSDAGSIDLVCRRSSDGGATWSALETLQGDGVNTWGNPCPVIDQHTGTIHLLLTHNLGGDIERQIIAGTSQARRTVWAMRSDDDGITWSPPREITHDVSKPDWAWYATGPGVGIQATNGRLIIPCDHITRGGGEAASHVMFSDDGGKHWQLGGSVPGDPTNECQVIERQDGSLLLKMRSHDRSTRCRLVSTSDDGGMTWTTAQPVPALPDPICQGALIREGTHVIFANAAHPEHRQNLTVRLSDDEGASWKAKRTIHQGPAAYSCLAALPDDRIACLFECGEEHPYERIDLARFPLEWIAESR